MGISAAPLTIEVVLEHDQSLAESTIQRNAVEQRLRRLREGRTIWARRVGQRETIERLRQVADLPSDVDRDALRSEIALLQTARARRAALILRAKSIAQTSHTQVTKAVEVFNREYLMPLNKLMNQINRAILAEPDIGIGLRVNKKKIEQTAIKSPDAPPHVSKLDPLLVHSEGQMAALAVSMLCAANLTFPWSRWSGIVLDDPLQHNDVIHVAAFADMLCNLIKAKRYQILLSTHDLAQAEFLRRKFNAASIPCTTVHLLGRGTNGVEAATKSYGGQVDEARTA